MAAVKLYLFNLLIGVDQLINVILGGAPDTTLSTRCWHHREHWAGAMAVKLIDFLFSWYEQDHCKSSAEGGDIQIKDVWG